MQAPAMDDPASWFEGLCIEGDDPGEPTTVTIPISSLDSPAITGEQAPYCTDCPAGVERHSLADHMPDQDWLDRTIRSYGEDHPYVIAKVFARFPKGGGGIVIPPSWVEAAMAFEGPAGDGWHRICDLGLDGETATHTVRDGAWVRLGVDVAAAAATNSRSTVRSATRSSSGTPRPARRTTTRSRSRRRCWRRSTTRSGSPHPVRVKVDQNGIGHGVVSMLERWAETGRHTAQIVGVMVSESPSQDDPGAVMRPWRKRDEIWLATGSLLQPDPSTGAGRLRLHVDKKAAAQLSTPNLLSRTNGYTEIESKKAMRSRGMKSPDGAEAVLLAVYEPEPLHKPRHRGLLN